jgi:SAM-dependent methyltransferase
MTNWEEKYQAGETPWDKGAPAPGLVDFLQSHGGLARASVCVPGCGCGHDVRAWAQAGFEAWGVDIAPSAIRRSQANLIGSGLNAAFRVSDFLSDEPPRLFDWVFEHTLFCAIDPKQRDKYVRAVRRWLKADGQFLAIYYLIPDEEGPPFGTTREEVMARFSPYFELREQWVPQSFPNRVGLEWMVWWQALR